jgi:hypothetical protein
MLMQYIPWGSNQGPVHPLSVHVALNSVTSTPVTKLHQAVRV